MMLSYARIRSRNRFPVSGSRFPVRICAPIFISRHLRLIFFLSEQSDELMLISFPIPRKETAANGYHYTHYNITSRLGALCTQDQYLPSPASLSMPLPSNGFPTLPTDQTATAKIRSVYRYVQYALLLSRTLLEVLGCSYYLLGCDFDDSASRST